MIVHLGAGWRLRSDPLQWIAEERIHGAKSKRHQWKPRAFCRSFDEAVVWAGRRRVMETPGEYGFDALPLLAAALDGILEEVRTALADYQKEDPAAGATACRADVHPTVKRRMKPDEITP